MKESNPFNKVIKKNKTIKEYPACHVYSYKDFRRYIGCNMDDVEIRKLETHCSKCSTCRKILLKIVKEEISSQQKEEMKFYFNVTMQYLDALDEEKRHKTNK